MNRYPSRVSGFAPVRTQLEGQGGCNLGDAPGPRRFLTKRLFVSPEVRMGLILVSRSTNPVGYQF